MGFLKAVFWGLLSLSLLVFVHEAGHFFASRLFHFRVTEFFLGLPCRYNLSKRSKKNGTLWGVTPLLLGGYNRICGMNTNLNDSLCDTFHYIMDRGEVNVEQMLEDMGLEDKELYSNLAILEDWASIEAVYPEGASQKEFAPVYRTVARDENFLTIYDKESKAQVNPVYPAGSVQIPEDDFKGFFAREKSNTYVGGSFWKRLVVVFAGPLINIVLALVLMTSAFYIKGLDVPVNVPTIGEVTANSLAERSGLRENDLITSVNGIDVSTFEELITQINNVKKEGLDLDLTIEREGEVSHIEISRQSIAQVQMIGVSPTVTNTPLSLGQAWMGAWGFLVMSVGYVIQILNPMRFLEVLNQSSSIVGISSMASSAAQNGLFTYVMFLAMVSMSLGLMNLLPIPPLDGGKIVLEIIEVIRRKPATERVQNIIAMVGIAYLFFIFLYTVGHDIIRMVF